MFEENEEAVGTLGATRQSWRLKAVRDLLLTTIKENPKATDKELRNAFVEHLRKDDDYFVAAGEYAFDNALRAWRRENEPSMTAAEKADIAAKLAQKASKHARLVSRIKVKALLNIMTPGGKKLRACTGLECLHFGGWYHLIAQRVGPTQLVGDVLDEKQLRGLYRAG